MIRIFMPYSYTYALTEEVIYAHTLTSNVKAMVTGWEEVDE